MKITVIMGTEVKGCTYEMNEMFLRQLPGVHEVKSFYLPKDLPQFCAGCKLCFEKGEGLCPHRVYVEPIWQAMLEADLLVFAYPVYVMRAPGQVKALLDHLACHWLVHRPDARMFTKRAVILTQSIGAPNGGAQKDVKTSLAWLGVSDIHCLGFGLREDAHWDKLSRKRKAELESKVRRLAERLPQTNRKGLGLAARAKFQMAKAMQSNILKSGRTSYDAQYWVDQGWIEEKNEE